MAKNSLYPLASIVNNVKSYWKIYIKFHLSIAYFSVSNFWQCNCNLAYKVQSVTARQEEQNDNGMK
jgi:hypothetical protein